MTAPPPRKEAIRFKLTNGHIRAYHATLHSNISELQIYFPRGISPTATTSDHINILIADHAIADTLRNCAAD